MGLRYRKSIKIAPGVKINLNKKSTSVTFGGKGYHKTINSNGRKTTSVNLPVPGLSYVDIDTPKKRAKKNAAASPTIEKVNPYTPPVSEEKQPISESKESAGSNPAAVSNPPGIIAFIFGILIFLAGICLCGVLFPVGVVVLVLGIMYMISFFSLRREFKKKSKEPVETEI